MKSERETGRFTNKSHNPKNRSNRFTSDELVFQPWFLPRHSRLAIDALIPPGYREKMRAYFDDYGCMICGRTNVIYDANGMCSRCHQTIRRRLRRSVRSRMTGKPDDRADLFMLRRAKLAKKLLGRFSPDWRARSLRHRLDTSLSINPIDEALGFLSPVIPKNLAQIPEAASSDEVGVWSKSVRDLPATRPRR
jgi:hypothetical protein